MDFGDFDFSVSCEILVNNSLIFVSYWVLGTFFFWKKIQNLNMDGGEGLEDVADDDDGENI